MSTTTTVSTSPAADVLATGEVAVHVRPVVDRETVEDLVHVQELLLVLSSEDGPTRVIEVGRKRLPDPTSDSPNWGYVREVGDDDVLELLDDETYRTATQGQRHQSSTQTVASGTWSLNRSASSTHLVLELTADDRDDDLLAQLHLKATSSYVMSAKNPRVASDAGLSDDERPDLPEDLQQVFDGNRWAPMDPVTLLDHVGVEFVLAAPGEDTIEQLD